MNRFFFYTLILTITSFAYVAPNLRAAEKDSGFAIIDKEPWKQSWVQEKDGNWKLTLLFDKAAIFTFFKKKPSKNTFLGLSEENKPLRQEIVFDDGISPITLVDSQYEQFGDGAICWAFKTEQNFIRSGQKYSGITTAIIDDPIKYNDEYRYSIWR